MRGSNSAIFFSDLLRKPSGVRKRLQPFTNTHKKRPPRLVRFGRYVYFNRTRAFAHAFEVIIPYMVCENLTRFHSLFFDARCDPFSLTLAFSAFSKSAFGTTACSQKYSCQFLIVSPSLIRDIQLFFHILEVEQFEHT